MDRTRLIEKLEALGALGWILAAHKGPSGITRTMRELLGLVPGSSFALDGFRILSKAPGSSHLTLLAKVPEWDKSKVKSTSEMLTIFGYGEDSDKRLNVTLEYMQPNSAGLYLDLEAEDKWIVSRSNRSDYPLVAVWDVEKVADAITEKFASAARIELDVKRIGTAKYFRVIGVTFLNNCSTQHVAELVRRRSLSIDHLQKISNGTPTEHGPLFRLDEKDVRLLFRDAEFLHFAS